MGSEPQCQTARRTAQPATTATRKREAPQQPWRGFAHSADCRLFLEPELVDDSVSTAIDYVLRVIVFPREADRIAVGIGSAGNAIDGGAVFPRAACNAF